MQNDPEWNDGFTTGLVVMTIAIVLVLIGIANWLFDGNING